MLSLVQGKTVQTTILAALLFYAFANPSTFKMVKKLPGLKFVMKGANEITHSGAAAHAVAFFLVMYLLVLVINSDLVKQHLKFLHVVENLENKDEL